MRSDWIIEAKNLKKYYGNFCAVGGISFDIAAGETFAILGENGAGKSTTMRMIACRSPISEGNLTVNGYTVGADDRKIRSVLGVVPQENNLDPDLNVLENLIVYSRYFRIPYEAALERSRKLLDFIRLSEKANAKVDSLSGGMKRRLVIARALIHEPSILLLDEPTTGLDPNVRQEIWEKIDDLRSERKITVVLSTHYMDEAEKLSGRLIVLANGKIAATGHPAELIRSRVGKFALEVREAKGVPLANVDHSITAVSRGSLHIYFGENTDELAKLMPQYGSRPMILRPSNLEDVFLGVIAS